MISSSIGMQPSQSRNAAIMPDTSSATPPTAWERMTRTLAHYERIEQIGEGTYGQVFRAKCLDTGRIVAMKKIRVHHGGYWGMPPTVLREIKILQRLRHPNLVEMVEVVSSKGVEYLDENDPLPEEKSSKSNSSKKDRVVDAREGYKGNIYLVLEYLSHDLTGLMDVAYRFTEVQVKCVFRQLLEALEYMHDNKYVHRDIKSSNILIDSHFRVKLADFGLARCIEPPILDTFTNRGAQQELTNKVITLWYRPPEILLGSTRYGFPVDVWSAGCILAELLLGKPLLPGKTEMDQLQLIFDLLGTPTPESWEGLNDLKLLRTGEVTIEKQRRPRLREKYTHKMPASALNLVEKLLELDPQKRLTAGRALTSRYFMSEPRAPDNPAELGVLQLGEGGGHFHEFQTKKKRREAKTAAKIASDEARARGMSEKQAEAEYDETYRQCMKKVAEQGNAGLDLQPPRKIDGSPPPKKEDRRKDRNERSDENGEGRDKSRAGRHNSHDHSERDDREESTNRKRSRENEKDDRAQSYRREERGRDDPKSEGEPGRKGGAKFVDHSAELFSPRDQPEEFLPKEKSAANGMSKDDSRPTKDESKNSRERRPPRDNEPPREHSQERRSSKECRRKSSHHDRDREYSRKDERDSTRHRLDRERGDRDRHKHHKSDRDRRGASRERDRGVTPDSRERRDRDLRRDDPRDVARAAEYYRGGPPRRGPPNEWTGPPPVPHGEPLPARRMPPGPRVQGPPPGYREERDRRREPDHRRGGARPRR